MLIFIYLTVWYNLLNNDVIDDKNCILLFFAMVIGVRV